jgi:hypothetical protein
LGRVSSNIGLTPSSLLSHAYPTDICGVSLVISHNFTHSSLFSTFYQCLNLFLNQAWKCQIIFQYFTHILRLNSDSFGP